MRQNPVTVIGAGPAGCAAALTAVRHRARVRLCEQRPERSGPVLRTALPCEFAGSNDLGVEDRFRASGLLKAELGEICPEPLAVAEASRVGEHTLAVDRTEFARGLLSAIEACDEIELVRGEVKALPDGVVVVATGPTTWSPLAGALHGAAGTSYSFSYAGRAPVISADGIDADAACWWPPYPGAEPALFVPVSDAEVDEFACALSEGERSELPDFTDEMILADEAIPIERMAGDPAELAAHVLRGPHGPDAPGQKQMLRLHPDDSQQSAFHLYRCVTALTEAAQKQALAAFRALGNVTIARPALVQRTPWLPGPKTLLPTLQLERSPQVLLAGSLTGAYGYMEAFVTGTAAGLAAARLAAGEEPCSPPRDCLSGALCWSLTEDLPGPDGRMIQANFGMLPDAAAGEDLSKQERRTHQIETAVAAARSWTQA